jgi:signal transduction histidine kinase
MATGTITSARWNQRRAAHTSVLRLVVIAGVLATALTAWTAAISPIFVDPAGSAFWRAMLVGSYCALGVYTWWRRPDSRFGPVVTAVALIYSLTSLAGSAVPLVHTLGTVFWVITIVSLAYLYLCYPSGRLESALERGFMVGFAVSMAVLWTLIVTLSPTLPSAGPLQDCGSNCPPNALQIISGPGLTGAALTTVFHIGLTIALIGLAMLIFSKTRASTRLRRRAMTPLAAVFIANITVFVITLFVAPAYPDARASLRVADGLVAVAVPIAILAGQLRGQMFAAMSLGEIVVRAGGRPLRPFAAQQLIGDALGDSTLMLALWSPARDRYVDVDGAPIELPVDRREHRVTYVTHDDRPVAALIHDPLLAPDSAVVEGVAATSLMLLENARLVDELRASRARIVDTAERERRRVEQDLHDGAQQRLIAIQIKLQIAREMTEQGDLARQLDAIQREAVTALDELRSLARGIYPPTLQQGGPAVALSSFARSASIPVQVVDRGLGRTSERVEAAIYFCAQEAIQNAAKHAGPGARVVVTLARRLSDLELVVVDDGVGMPVEAQASGFGIASMRDRIEAVGGEFEIARSPLGGTSVRAVIPDPELERSD